jgi:hypothetical protein
MDVLFRREESLSARLGRSVAARMAQPLQHQQGADIAPLKHPLPQRARGPSTIDMPDRFHGRAGPHLSGESTGIPTVRSIDVRDDESLQQSPLNGCASPPQARSQTMVQATHVRSEARMETTIRTAFQSTRKPFPLRDFRLQSQQRSAAIIPPRPVISRTWRKPLRFRRDVFKGRMLPNTRLNFSSLPPAADGA